MAKNGNGLKGLVAKIRAKYSPQKVILFGSRARGDNLKGSDYDLLVIASAFNSLSFRERIIGVYDLLSKPMALDAICLTPKEFARKKGEIGVIRLAVKEGLEM